MTDYKDRVLAIVDKMEQTRTRNNVNWMNVLRLAVKWAPREEVKTLFANISDRDEEIGDLWKELLIQLHD